MTGDRHVINSNRQRIGRDLLAPSLGSGANIVKVTSLKVLLAFSYW